LHVTLHAGERPPARGRYSARSNIPHFHFRACRGSAAEEEAGAAGGADEEEAGCAGRRAGGAAEEESRGAEEEAGGAEEERRFPLRRIASMAFKAPLRPSHSLRPKLRPLRQRHNMLEYINIDIV